MRRSRRPPYERRRTTGAQDAGPRRQAAARAAGLRLPGQLGVPRRHLEHRGGAADPEPARPWLRRQPDQQGHRPAQEGGGHRRRPRPVRGEPRRLRTAALRREGQAGRRRADRDRLADRLGATRGQRLRGGRGSHGARPAHQAPGRRALRQRHRPGDAGAEALDGRGVGGHPADHRQPEAGVHPPVLHDRAARHGGQRRRGPALRRHRHA